MQRLFEAELGTSLGYFFDQWVRGRGYPVFGVRWNQAGTTLQLQSVQASTGATPFFRTAVDYQLTYADGSQQLVRLAHNQPAERYQVAVRGPVQRIDLDPDGWLPDPGSTVQYDPQLVLAAPPAKTPASVGAYPNPCREQLTLSGLPAAPVAAEVRNALGQLVLQQPLSAAQPVLVTAGLVPGLYVVQLLGPAGQAVGRVRFARE